MLDDITRDGAYFFEMMGTREKVTGMLDNDILYSRRNHYHTLMALFYGLRDGVSSPQPSRSLYSLGDR